MKLIILAVMFASFVSQSYSSTKVQFNDDFANKTLSRSKRFLLFPAGSTARYILGYLGPIDSPAVINMNAVRNIQFWYDLPSKIVTIYNKFNKRSFDKRPIKGDSSREIAYQVLEQILNKERLNGHECILRTICEVAETPLGHNGLIGELLQLFFSPGAHEIIDDDYKNAQNYGFHGVDCIRMYPECPFGSGILDSVSLVQDFRFEHLMSMI